MGRSRRRGMRAIASGIAGLTLLTIAPAVAAGADSPPRVGPTISGPVSPAAPAPTPLSVPRGAKHVKRHGDGVVTWVETTGKRHHKAPVVGPVTTTITPERVTKRAAKPKPKPKAHHPQTEVLAAHAASPPPEATNPERTSLSDHLLSPTELDLSAETLAESGMLTFLLIALLYLPVTIFNKATEKNHETISAWFSRPRAWVASIGALIPFSRHPLATLTGGVLASTALFAFVEPGFPTHAGSLQYLVGMLLGFTLVSVVFFTTWILIIRRLEPESEGHWRIYPVYVVLGAIFVVLARLAHFLPGVVIGTMAEYEPTKPLGTRTAGIRVLTTYSALIVLGLAAWFAWIPIEHAAAEHGASSVTLILDSMLAITFVASLESVAFGLIPMKFLDGHDLFAWHKGLWALLWGGSLFWFAEVILHPALSTYHEIEGARIFWMVLLFSSLMIVAVATWGYFRYRDGRGSEIAQAEGGS